MPATSRVTLTIDDRRLGDWVIDDWVIERMARDWGDATLLPPRALLTHLGIDHPVKAQWVAKKFLEQTQKFVEQTQKFVEQTKKFVKQTQESVA